MAVWAFRRTRIPSQALPDRPRARHRAAADAVPRRVAEEDDALIAVMRRIALPVYAPSLFSAIAQNAVQILLPLYALEIGGGAALAAAVVGLRGAGTMIGDVPAGLLVTRIGDKGVMIVGLLAVLASVLAASVTTAVPLLAFASLGFGAGVGVWLLARMSFITETVRQHQRGRVISVLAGLQRAGALVGPLAAGAGAEAFGFSAVFAGAAALLVVSLALVIICSKGGRPALRQPAGARLLHVVRGHAHTFATAGSVMVILSFLRAARLLMIPLVGTSLGLGTTEIGLAFSLSAAIDMVMFYPAGIMLDRLGRKWTLAPAMLLLGAGVAALPFAAGFWSFVAAALLAGLGNGFGTGIFMTLGGDFSPQRGRGEFLGVWRLVGDAGAAVGPFAMGAAAQWASLAVACAATGALALAGVAVLLALVPETLRRPSVKPAA